MNSYQYLSRFLTLCLAFVASVMLIMGFTPPARSFYAPENHRFVRNDSAPQNSGQQNKNTNRRRRTKARKTGSTSKQPIDTDGEQQQELPDVPPATPLEVSTPPALTTCGLGSGADKTSITLEPKYNKVGSLSLEIILSDPVRANESRTVINLTINGKTYQYQGTLKDAASPLSLKLPQDMILKVGDKIELVAEEQYTPSGTGCSMQSVKSDKLTYSLTFPSNPIKLLYSSANEWFGCHGQGIKFDGAFFYSACQEKSGDNKAMAYIHDVYGNQLCSFTLGDTYDHPGGLVIYPGEMGMAYLGFSDYLKGDTGQPVRIAYNYINRKCRPLLELNKGNEVNSSLGFATRHPTDQCKKDTTWSGDITFYNDYTSYYNTCGKDGQPCRAQGYIDQPSWLNSSQDCGYYWDGAWYKVCIALSNDENFVQVFQGNSLTMDEKMRLATFALNPTSSGGWIGKNSGGVDIYTDANGNRYLIIAPHASGGDCGGELPCTTNNVQKAQLVEVHSFTKWKWPNNSTHKICP